MASVHFVYLLLDPKETGDELFYIGQGQGSRPADHAQESLDWDAGGRPMPAATGTKTPEEIRAKRLRILKILASGRTPRIEFLRTGLSKREVDIVETAAIELIGLDNLCNQVMGPAGKGRMLATAHETLQGSKDLTLDEAAVVVPVKGVWGGSLDYAGLIGQDEAQIWENARRRWSIAAGESALLDDAHPPVLLVAVPSGEGFSAGSGVVVGMWEIAGVEPDELKDGQDKWQFRRHELTDRLSGLRKTFLGHRIQVKGQVGVRYLNL